ncbi:hypothetical protein KAT92_04010 [Candidatus Babeliales bacterium]|nr:hypothetical protein [Candidatus Babeliales bacterium]
MRKFFYVMLAILVSTSCAQARTHTNKTFLMPRSHLDNMAMEYSTWHKQFRDIDEEKWGSSIQATGFYQESTNQSALGKYFGKYNNATGPNITNPYAGTIQDFIWVMERSVLAGTPNFNNEKALLLESRWIIHDPKEFTPSSERLNVKGTFRPKQESYGIRLDYHQKLDKLAKGLYFKVSVPFVDVTNDMEIAYTGTADSSRLTQTLPDQDLVAAASRVKKSLADYLSGNITTTRQKALTHAKIAGSDSDSGVADIDVTLGYNFLYKEHKHLNANICLTIPTGNRVRGEKLFEAMVGNGHHWALGCGVDSAFELWKDEDSSLDFLFAANYKYLFDATEKRTLDFKYSNTAGTNVAAPLDTFLTAGKRVPMGYYFLGGKRGERQLFPLANVLTRDVGVDPGSQLEVLASLAFNHKGFTFDLGYNLFAKEGESVMVKDWPENTYAIAKQSFKEAAGADELIPLFDPTNINHAWGGGDGYKPMAIAREHLLEQDAATPVYVTHKIFGGMGYSYDEWDYPLMFGLGGSWEFTQGTNSALDGWALYGKIGVSF